MTLTTLFTILGILATIVFGTIAIVLTLKRKYPGHITFIKEDCISLFHDITKNMPELQINFENEPVKENLVLLKGYILNTGSKDITEEMVVKKLTIDIREGSRWVKSKVVDSSENVNAKTNINTDTTIDFNLGLFRSKEFVKFECLAETAINTDTEGQSPSNYLLESIDFKHRIADTGKVAKWVMPIKPTKRHPWFVWLILMLPLAFSAILLFEGEPINTKYILNDSAGKEVKVEAKRNLFGKIMLKQVDGEYKLICNEDEFFKMGEIRPVPSEEWIEKYSARFFTGLLYIFVLAIIISVYIRFYKYRKLGNLLTKRST